MGARADSAARRRAGLLAGYTIVALAAGAVLAHTGPPQSHRWVWWQVVVAVGAISGTAGLLLLRLPGHGITRVLTLIAMADATGTWLGPLTEHTTGAARAVLERFGNVLWAGHIPVLAVLILLFPTGKPPGPRWVPVFRLQLVALGVLVAGALIGAQYRPVQVVAVICAATLIVTAALAAVSLVIRWRRADPSGQAGIRAFAVVAVGLVAWYVVGGYVLTTAGFGSTADIVVWLLAVGLPVAIGYGVLRHRLYGIDVVIRRAVAWSLVSAAVLSTYLAAVVVATATIGPGRTAPVLAAALVALVLAPLARVAQAAVDRLFYGRRGDPAGVLVQAGRSLAAAGGAAEVPQKLVDLVTTTLRLPWTGVELDREGHWAAVAAAGRRDPYGAEPEVVTLRTAGEEPARLLVQPRRGERALSPVDRRLLDDLAAQVAPALLSVRLVDELERSRDRLLAARHDERERLRRDLHDTLSPALNGMRLAVAAARGLLRGDPDRADRLLASVSGTTGETAESVRRMLSRLRPAPMDDEHDLAAAIRRGVGGVTGAGGMSVEVRSDIRVTALPAPVTEAVFRIAVEAVTNAARHSGARHCTVVVDGHDDVTVEVCDDGRGLPDPVPPGVGLESMTARATELGGYCEVRRRVAGGTRVRAVLPIGGPP